MISPATETKRPPSQAATSPALIAPNHELLVRESFDDIALLVGSVASLYNLDDDLLWTLMKRLDRIRVKLLRNLIGGASREDFEPAGIRPPRTHAAVDEFLARNRGRMGE